VSLHQYNLQHTKRNHQLSTGLHVKMFRVQPFVLVSNMYVFLY
jgi:hypothetical protein